MLLKVILIGIGATLCIDLWSLLLRRAFGISSLNYCMLGRWALHIPSGTLAHQNIASASAKPHECKTGWTLHYAIGMGFAAAFLLAMPDEWITQPTLLPALGFGVATVLVPFFTVQPALGLGVASSRVANPRAARLKSVATHAVFGVGLYVFATVVG